LGRLNFRALEPGRLVLAERLRRREPGGRRERHLRRVAELAESIDRVRVEDVLVETVGRERDDVAEEVLRRCGWFEDSTPTGPSRRLTAHLPRGAAPAGAAAPLTLRRDRRRPSTGLR
jgi:hypothetical protein